MEAPGIIFGCASVGESFKTAEEVNSLLEVLQTLQINHLDTASRYPPTAPGQSENLLGAAQADSRGFVIDTKIKTSLDGSGTLTEARIAESVRDSFSRLRLDKVNTLYCHGPDSTTPLEEQAAALHQRYADREFEKLGVSNFSIDMLEDFLNICQEKGYVKPSVYQGEYNAICRRAEHGLFPFLRKHGFSYTSYSPLAGGILTGKMSAGASLHDSRFKDGHPVGIRGKKLYDKPAIHAAIRHLNSVVQSQNITLAEASLRWLASHSALGKGDGIILGASREAQIHDNCEAISKGPLPAEVVEAFDHMWKDVESEAPPI